MAVGDKSDEKAIKALLDLASAKALTLFQTIIANVAVLEHHEHSRSRVYPQNVGAVATLIAAAEADKYGDWIEIIPEDTVDFKYEVVG
ncbi:unnamed protein product, partial [marine sediment metagenome]